MYMGCWLFWRKTVVLTGVLAISLHLLALSGLAQETVTGQVKAVSRKAQTIQVDAGSGPTMVKFTNDTAGMEYVKVGEAAIFEYEMVGEDRVAIIIKPRLVKLPAGAVEIKTEEIAELVALGPEQGKYHLVDSRPAGRYAEGHIPTAVSIPVPLLTKTGHELLPADKDTLLIFYCGGPT
jgi:hypothetical protein